MGLLDIVFCAFLAFFAWRGYVKGFLGSVSRLLSWLVAYPAAIFFTRPLGKVLIHYTPLDGLLVYFVAGSGIFLVVSFAVSSLLEYLADRIPADSTAERASKFGGLAFGLVFGGLLGLVVVYVLSQVPKSTLQLAESPANSGTHDQVNFQNQTDSQSAKADVPSMAQLAGARDSFIEASAKKLVSQAAATAVKLTLKDDTATQITRAFVEDPQTMLTHVQAVSQDGQMQGLLRDEKIQQLMAQKNIDGLMQTEEFKNLVNNPHMQALMEESEVNSEKGARDAAEKLVTAWSRIDQIKTSPQVIAIINDPEFQQQLNSPNKMALMMNPKLNQLTEIIFNPPEADNAAGTEPFSANTHSATQIQQPQEKYEIREVGQGVSSASDSEQDAQNEEKTRAIYRWTDESGRVHYSDKPTQ